MATPSDGGREPLARVRLERLSDVGHLCRELRVVGARMAVDGEVVRLACRAIASTGPRLRRGGIVELRVDEGELVATIDGLAARDLPIVASRLRRVSSHVRIDGERLAMRIGACGPTDATGDDSELQRVNEELRSANAQLVRQARALHRSNEDLRRFSSVVGHDLKVPLDTIGTYVELLSRQVDTSEARESVEAIRTSCDRLRAMLEGLLAYARSESDPPPAPPIDPTPALQEALANLDGPLRRADATVVLADLPHLPVPHIHLVEIFQNLLANAVKYRGHDPLEIRIEGVTRADGPAVIVRDNGRGIPTAHQEHIFGLFARLDRDRDREGVGLGLSLVARLVDRSGGTVRCLANHPSGAAFELHFRM